VLKPGGTIAILEFTEPPDGLLGDFYRWSFFAKSCRGIGGLISGDRSAYTYRQNLVARFFRPPELAALMSAAGYQFVDYRALDPRHRRSAHCLARKIICSAGLQPPANCPYLPKEGRERSKLKRACHCVKILSHFQLLTFKFQLNSRLFLQSPITPPAPHSQLRKQRLR